MLVVRKTTVLWMGLFLIFAMAGMVILPDTEIDNLQFLGWQDGFFSQMNHIQYFYIWSDFEPLSQLNAHLVRWLLYYPIFHFGPHDYFFYALYAAPISFLLARQKMWLVILVLLLMPFALSLRSGLAAIGLVSVYFVMFHRLNAGLVLTFGALLCVFSSATLLQASIFFCYVVYKRGLRLKEVIPLLIMLTFLVIGVSDKVSGALAGDVGYVDGRGKQQYSDCLRDARHHHCQLSAQQPKGLCLSCAPCGPADLCGPPADQAWGRSGDAPGDAVVSVAWVRT